MSECEHGSDPQSCPPCRAAAGKPSKPAVLASTLGEPFAARFAGQCPGCNLPIREGQRIRSLSTTWQETMWVHVGCEP